MQTVRSGSIFAARAGVVCVAVGLLAACGCGPSPVRAPAYDPDGMARAAMAEYDKNGDGKLDAMELQASQGLKIAAFRISEGKRDVLTEEELAERLRQFKDSKIGLRSVRCVVTRGGEPLQGVTVTYVPEGFMGSAFKSGSAVTDARGDALPRIEGEEILGLSLGYYRVQLSLKDSSGKETIDARYNSRTILGDEIPNTKSETPRFDIE